MHFVIETYPIGRTVLCRDRQLQVAFASLAVARRFAESLRVYGSSRHVATHCFDSLLQAEAYVTQKNIDHAAAETPAQAEEGLMVFRASRSAQLFASNSLPGHNVQHR